MGRDRQTDKQAGRERDWGGGGGGGRIYSSKDFTWFPRKQKQNEQGKETKQVESVQLTQQHIRMQVIIAETDFLQAE